MSEKVLITGGAGFIGSALVNDLISEGKEVWVIDDLSFGSLDFIKLPKSNLFLLDILDKEGLIKAVQVIKPEWVIHLAAVHFIPYCNQHPFESSRINLLGTMNLLEALQYSDSVKKVFFASTAAVYPNINEPIHEGIQPQPMDIYGLSKLVGEQLFIKFHFETNLPVIICRFFNAFGPNETNPHLIPEILNQIKGGSRSIRLGNLDPKRDFIHTFDMSRALRLLLQKEMPGVEIFNLGRGIEYSVKEIVTAFERQLGESIKIEVDPARVRKVERMHLLADITKLKQFTGWEPQWSIDMGISNLLEK